MPLKRSYQVPSQYTRGSKRARTLESQVSSLKKQVSKNKSELKYYDGYFATVDSPTGDDARLVASFFTDVVNEDGTQPQLPVFIGRKVYIRKMEIRVDTPSASLKTHGLIWREKRQGKGVDFINGYHPLALDPEYHTLLRRYDKLEDSQKSVWHFTIDFGQQGRLVEFDEQSTAIAQGAIVQGDIKMNYYDPDGQPTPAIIPISFRVWYTDT